MNKLKNIICIGLLASSAFAFAKSAHKKKRCSVQGTFTPLTNQPNFKAVSYPGGPTEGGALNTLLMTDGGIMVFNDGFGASTSEVWKLSPDINGSYINGTWSQLASLPDNYAPLFGANAVLADGRIIAQGGEYDGTNFHFALTNRGYIYDPVADTWTKLPPPPFFENFYPPRRLYAPRTIADASSVVLEDGTYIVQDKMTGQAAILDLATLTWKETGTSTKFGWNDEESLTLLPNGKVLTVHTYTESGFIPNLNPPPAPSQLTVSQLYNPKTGEWEDAGSTVVPLTDLIDSEIGSTLLRPDGKVVVFGGAQNGATAIYNSKKNQWTVGPKIPVLDGVQLDNADLPAVLLPNGNIFTSLASGFFVPPLSFWELTYEDFCFVQQPSTPNSSFNPNQFMMLLPTGQVMVTDSTNDVQIYTPGDRSYDPDWAPVIKNVPTQVVAGNTYRIDGIRFNGMSRAVDSVGDDAQSATNYPLVRIKNSQTGHIFYARTHDHSFMGVASDKCVHTFFDVPANIETGTSTLEVVANGIPSKPVTVVVR